MKRDWGIPLLAAVIFISDSITPASLWAHGAKPTKIHAYVHPTEVEVEVEVNLAYRLLSNAVPQLHTPQKALDENAIRSAWLATEKYLFSHLSVIRSNSACKPKTKATRSAANGRLLIDLLFQCSEKGDVTIQSNMFVNLSTAHRILLYVEGPGDQIYTETMNAGANMNRDTVHTKDSPSVGFVGFIQSGIQHILSGPDHVLFVLGLLLVTFGRWRALMLAVTGFTIAHSITLALAALGRLSIPSHLVEPIIAASIAYLGMEALFQLKRSKKLWGAIIGLHLLFLVALATGWLRFSLPAALGLSIFCAGYGGWLVYGPQHPTRLGNMVFPFCFGLVHGLGFAGPLIEMNLPAQLLGWALLGFNVGVEIGQLMTIAAVLMLIGALYPLRNRINGRPLRWAMSALMLTVGIVWMVLRTLPGNGAR